MRHTRCYYARPGGVARKGPAAARRTLRWRMPQRILAALLIAAVAMLPAGCDALYYKAMRKIAQTPKTVVERREKAEKRRKA